MSLSQKESVNSSELWYNNSKRNAFGKELLGMAVRRTARPSRKSRIKLPICHRIIAPKVILASNDLDSTCGVPDDVLTARFSKAVDNAIAIKKLKGQPIAMYDKRQRQAYLQYPDGSKVYVK